MTHPNQYYYLPDVEETSKELGRGSYGVVLEMKLPDGSLVAGKMIHSTFLDPDNFPASGQSLKEKFEQECQM